MKYMDKLPTVISCCFCCFLRAGTVMIAIFSFITGVFLAPNVSHTPGFWDMYGLLRKSGGGTELVVQMTLGIISIMLCIVSILLLVGALCSIPTLLECYQWGVVIYSSTVSVLFLTLAAYCNIVLGNCALAGGFLVMLMFVTILLTMYFVIVVNSLRMSMLYLCTDTLNI